MKDQSGVDTVQSTEQIKHLQDQVEQGLEEIIKQSERTRNADNRLRQLETKFEKKISTVHSIIDEVLMRARVHDSEESDDSESEARPLSSQGETARSLDPELSRYYDRVGDVKLLQDAIFKLGEERYVALADRERLRDQEVKLPCTHSEFEESFVVRRQHLQRDLDAAESSARELRSNCACRGIEVEDMRYRFRGPPQYRPLGIDEWLEDLEVRSSQLQSNSGTDFSRFGSLWTLCDDRRLTTLVL